LPACILIKGITESPSLAGWWGYRKDKQFDMSLEFEKAVGAGGGWQIGTPRLLSLAPLEGSLKIFQEAGINRVREKSLKLTKALKDRDIIPDFRYPNIIRLAPVALYNTFYEVWQVVEALREIIDRGEQEKYDHVRDAVT